MVEKHKKHPRKVSDAPDDKETQEDQEEALQQVWEMRGSSPVGMRHNRMSTVFVEGADKSNELQV